MNSNGHQCKEKMTLREKIEKILSKNYGHAWDTPVDQIEKLFDKQKKELIIEIHSNICQLAKEGKEDKDELKGVMLFTRIMNYLNKLNQQEKKNAK